jgi:hypothetical protein
MRRPSFKTTAISGLVLLVVAQALRPARTNPPVEPSRTIEARTNIPPEVLGILKRSCYDCHSNATTWPWYSNVAPVSWIVVSHVNNGREHMSLSDWAQYDPDKSRELLGEMCEEVETRGMPLGSYLLAHRSASLNDADVRAVCEWTERERTAGAAPK